MEFCSFLGFGVGLSWRDERRTEAEGDMGKVWGGNEEGRKRKRNANLEKTSRVAILSLFGCVYVYTRWKIS